MMQCEENSASVEQQSKYTKHHILEDKQTKETGFVNLEDILASESSVGYIPIISKYEKQIIFPTMTEGCT